MSDTMLPTVAEIQTLIDRARQDVIDLQTAIDDASLKLADKFTPQAELGYSSLVARLAGAKLRIAPLQAELANAGHREALADFRVWAQRNGQINRDIAALQAAQQACYAEIEALNLKIKAIDKNAVLQHASSLYVKLRSQPGIDAAEIDAIWKAG